MGIIESVRGVLWARRRQPDQPVYGIALGHERFRPDELLRQAVAAENARFDIVCCSDHLAPWWAPGDPAPAACGNPWVWLGAAGQATHDVSIGSAVTGIVHRYNPAVVAQQVATLEALCPGRTFLGVGSGEAMNEVPAGFDWPPVGEQLARTEEALTIITRLLDGETVSFDGRYFRTKRARLYLETERRPPVYMSAFGERAAEIAGRLADGVWTLADPQKAPAVIADMPEGFLVFEVEVDGGGGVLDGAGDTAHGDGVIAFGDEHVAGRIEDEGANLLALTFSSFLRSHT